MNTVLQTHYQRKKGIRYSLALSVLKIIGWRIDYKLPESPKFILIAAPHTSNWDLPVMLLISIVMGIKLKWVAKDTLFKGWFGSYLRWLGGIPVNRKSRTNFTEQVVSIFNNSKNLIIVIAPEGTRSFTPYWRTGFYHIASGAAIPIALGFLDYKNKVGGIGPNFIPRGDIESDFRNINDFYKNITGLKPENFGPVIPKPKE